MKKPILSVRSLTSAYKYSDKKRYSRKSVPLEVDESTKTVFSAIDDLHSLLKHVRALMKCDFSRKIGLLKSFDDLEGVLGNIRKSVIDGNEVRFWTYDENEELEELEEVLDNLWSECAVLDRVGDNEEGELFVRLIGYWMSEIKNRGYTIHGLLNGSEDFETVRISLQHLLGVNYPPEYGEME